jgi:hydroxypyruvate isomerase
MRKCGVRSQSAAQRLNCAKFSASISMMARKLPIAERFEVLKACGLDGVEIQVLAEVPKAELTEAVRNSGLDVALVNVDMGDLATGGPGLSGVPGREAAFMRHFAEASELAAHIGIDTIHVGPSKIPPGYAREQCWSTYRTNIEHAVRKSEGAPFRIVIEPINSHDLPGVLLSSFDQARTLLNETGPLLLLDVYHAAKMALDPARVADEFARFIHHVQVSDTPARTAPGTGSIDFAEVFAALGMSGYDGWIGAEYALDAPEPTDFEWTMPARRALNKTLATSRSKAYRQTNKG